MRGDPQVGWPESPSHRRSHPSNTDALRTHGVTFDTAKRTSRKTAKAKPDLRPMSEAEIMTVALGDPSAQPRSPAQVSRA
jgi:hypothetical protein